MNPTHIEHIGIAVKCLEDSIKIFERLLGIPCYSIEEIETQNVKTAFFLIGQTKIELLESTDIKGPIGSFISNKGEGIHHIAFAVEDTDCALEIARQNGFRLIDRECKRGAEGLKIGFLHPKSTNNILIELCSK
jgi:methylmalonyl-CoA/ethylmalonyl-CoA epimerase